MLHVEQFENLRLLRETPPAFALDGGRPTGGELSLQELVKAYHLAILRLTGG